MKFLPLPDFDVVASALNFDTPDIQVIGGCDLYTTKAAGSDKKLYRNIDKSLESQHESLVRMSSSFSPPDDSLDLSRASPFGPLSQISSRRTFAYLIATLNASHPDYDFSHILRPSDFRMEQNLLTVMNTINSTLSHLSPSMSDQMPMTYMTSSSPTATNQLWGPQMWTYIDNEMELKDCSIYAYEPVEDLYEEEEGTIWSLNYFFFNKQLKRVAYLYVRGVPVLNLSHTSRGGLSKRRASGYDIGANKRARYWLGNRADDVSGGDSDGLNWDPEDDVDFEGVTYDADGYCENYADEADDESDDFNHGSPVRAVSEDVAARMEIEI